ncbi:transposase, partial [Mesorhizobium sp. M8A.F.Ca.ET.202.01.1.1]
ANLKTAWKSGETRPTHRRPYRRTKPYPKRPSMYEPFEAQIKEGSRKSRRSRQQECAVEAKL